MITQIDISGINYDIDDNTEKYILKRIGKLDHYLPRHSRKSVSVKVTIKRVDKSHGNKYEVAIIMDVPGKVIAVKDESSNVLAGIDILEAKIMSQIKKYKLEKMPHVGKKSLWAKLKRTKTE